MSLYDDFKKNKENNSKKTSGETTEKTLNKDNSKSDEISVGSEVYRIVNIPFYKKKEFYMLIGGVIVVIVVLFLLLYTPKFKMEDLTGKNREYVQTYGEAYELNVSIKEQYNDEVEKGQVFSQTLKASSNYSEGSVLEVVISLGPDYEIEVDYPDFKTLNLTAAKKWRSDNRVVGIEIIEEYNNDYEKDAFIKEELDQGTDKAKFKRSSKGKIYYSLGPEPVKTEVSMTNLKGKTAAEAALWAKEKDLEMNVVEKFDDYLTPSMIIDQSIASGKRISKGTSFEVTISVGPGVSVPSFANTTPETAANMGVMLGRVDHKYSANVTSGNLISQSYAAGTKIKDTDKVDLVYSLGLVPIKHYVGISYLDMNDIITQLNNSGANLKVYYVEWDIKKAPEGTIEGTVASHDIINDLVVRILASETHD